MTCWLRIASSKVSSHWRGRPPAGLGVSRQLELEGNQDVLLELFERVARLHEVEDLEGQEGPGHAPVPIRVQGLASARTRNR